MQACVKAWSSAYAKVVVSVDCVMTSGRVLMRQVKRTGPKMPPCGTEKLMV